MVRCALIYALRCRQQLAQGAASCQQQGPLLAACWPIRGARACTPAWHAHLGEQSLLTPACTLAWATPAASHSTSCRAASAAAPCSATAVAASSAGAAAAARQQAQPQAADPNVDPSRGFARGGYTVRLLWHLCVQGAGHLPGSSALRPQGPNRDGVVQRRHAPPWDPYSRAVSVALATLAADHPLMHTNHATAAPPGVPLPS